MLVKLKQSCAIGLNNSQLFQLEEGMVYDLPDWQAKRLISSGRAASPGEEDMALIVEEANMIADKELASRQEATQLPSASFTDAAQRATVTKPEEAPKKTKAEEAEKSGEPPADKKSRTFSAE